MAADAGHHERGRAQPEVRGEGALRGLEGLFIRLDSLVDRALPEELSPFAQSGAIANTTFLVAIVSGIVLLFWYSPSLTQAYGSVDAMTRAPLAAGFVRSVHRYSSDGCMLFVLVHAARLFAARRFGGARWLSWVTGVLLVATLWLVGWLGYWLVWDERGRQVALGTARALDALPFFADPLSRSFLTDDSASSLLFFVVFFVHMLIPLAMGVALWLHITRISRSRFLTNLPLTAWVLVSLLLVSVVAPADLARRAHMTEVPSGFAMDAWYLAPVALTDRLGAGALWAIALGAGVALYVIPWALVRAKPTPSVVVEARCNSCETCYKDCPYDAITMAPRTDGRDFAARASVDPSRCVGCGICAGSCDSAGIGLTWLDVLDQRRRLDAVVEAAVAGEGHAFVAFVCAESAGGALAVDEKTHTSAALPGFVVIPVPCAGFVHTLTLERAIRHGAKGALVVACGPGTCAYREGALFARERAEGARKPALNVDKVDPAAVRVIEVYRTDVSGLAREARAFREGRAPRERPARARRWAGGALVALACTALTWAGSRMGYALPPSDDPVLVVSFKHPGQVLERCRELTEEEQQKTPPHMRAAKKCERRRNAVFMRVSVDDRVVASRSYEPAGLWSDGNSLAIERISVPAGRHKVKVELGDTGREDEIAFRSEETVELAPHRLKVVRFDRTTGFEWR